MKDLPHIPSMEQEAADHRTDLAIEYITAVLGYPNDGDAPDALGEPIGDGLQSAIEDAMRRSPDFYREVTLAVRRRNKDDLEHREYLETLGLIADGLKSYGVDAEVGGTAPGAWHVEVRHPEFTDEILMIDAGDSPWGWVIATPDYDMKIAGVMLPTPKRDIAAYEMSKRFREDIVRLGVAAGVAWSISRDAARFVEFLKADGRFDVTVDDLVHPESLRRD